MIARFNGQKVMSSWSNVVNGCMVGKGVGKGGESKR